MKAPFTKLHFNLFQSIILFKDRKFFSQKWNSNIWNDSDVCVCVYVYVYA